MCSIEKKKQYKFRAICVPSWYFCLFQHFLNLFPSPLFSLPSGASLIKNYVLDGDFLCNSKGQARKKKYRGNEWLGFATLWEQKKVWYKNCFQCCDFRWITIWAHLQFVHHLHFFKMVPSQAKPKIATTEDKEKRCNSNKPFPYKTEQFPTDTWSTEKFD